MSRDVLMAKQLGADGVVFGLPPEWEGRLPRTRQLVNLSSTKYYFPPGFRQSSDLLQSLDDVVGVGVEVSCLPAAGW